MRVQKSVKIIAGTDWWTDCDDAVALRLLARAHLRGEIELLGVAVNACMEDSAPSLDAYLGLEGLPNLPLGIDLAATDYGGRPPYQRRLAAMAMEKIKGEFQEKSWQAFWRTAVEGEGVAEVSKSLSMSAGAIYVAKSRVLARLKEEVDALRKLEDE